MLYESKKCIFACDYSCVNLVPVKISLMALGEEIEDNWRASDSVKSFTWH